MKHAVVTGAASGLGRALTDALVAAGCHVTALDKHAGDLPTRHGVDLFVVDLCDRAAVQAALARRSGPPVDLVVHAAAFAVFSPLGEADLDAVTDMFAVNVLGAAAVLQSVLPDLRATSGTVVQISSLSGRIALPGSGYYAATKHALEAMSDALAIEEAPWGIRVIVVQPGSLDTPFQASAAQHTRPLDPDGLYRDVAPVWDRVREGLLAPPVPVSGLVDALMHRLQTPSHTRGVDRLRFGADADLLLEGREQLGDAHWTRWMIDTHAAAPDENPSESLRRTMADLG